MTITDESFLAFLNCETKSFLKSSGVVGDQREPRDWRQRLDEEFERKCCIELRAHFREDECLTGVSLSKVLENNQCRLAMDCVAETLEIQSRLHALERLTPTGNIKPDVYVPIRFVHGKKITTQNKMLLSFDVLALYTSLGTMPPFGRIIHGSKLATVKVKVAGLVQTVQGIITRITAQHASQKPPHLVLCKHCPDCEFRTRCHQIATENDDLSLLSGMTEKERRKQHSRGIFTVTQLSYTFRARRKPKRLVSKPDKYSHALKALAIRERKICVAGTPDSIIHRQPVYLDVEGIPDRNFYYLIGLRVKNGDEFVQHSFWANEPSEEKETWVSFLRTLAKIDNPQLLYYGSYETQFLKRMKERYPDVIEDPALLDRLIRESVNILSAIYAQIYFPTYSNGLEEIAQYLGFRWSDSNATGLHALTLRHEWELSKDSSLK